MSQRAAAAEDLNQRPKEFLTGNWVRPEKLGKFQQHFLTQLLSFLIWGKTFWWLCWIRILGLFVYVSNICWPQQLVKSLNFEWTFLLDCSTVPFFKFNFQRAKTSNPIVTHCLPKFLSSFLSSAFWPWWRDFWEKAGAPLIWEWWSKQDFWWFPKPLLSNLSSWHFTRLAPCWQL